MFDEPKEPQQKKLILRNGVEICLIPEQYFVTKNQQGQLLVLKHNVLVEIAEQHNYRVVKTVLEFGVYNNPKNFCFIYRAFGTIEGNMMDEVGEANPKNLVVGSDYPAIMANKRAQDRLLIRLLGLQGQVYSDSEINNDCKSQTETLTTESALELMVDYGNYKKSPVTLGELKETNPKDFDWICNAYKIGKNSSSKMVKLHRAAQLLVNAE